MLLDNGECCKTRDPEGTVPRTPTGETVPQCSLAICVGIVHKLRAFIGSKEPMVRGRVMIFAFELGGGQYTVNLGDGRLQIGRTYCFLPVMGDKLIVLVEDKPVEPRIYLRQSDTLRVLTTVEDQPPSNSRRSF